MASFGPSGPGGQIVIDDIRAILALTRTRPHEARARVIVVDDADAMNPSSANGLLKTLEEPLAGNHLVLCTGAPDRLLPTVRSRAQRIRFRALSPTALAAIARARGLPEARAEIAVALADGSAARMLEAAGTPAENEGDGDGNSGLGQALGELRRAVSTPGAGQLFDAVQGLAGEKESKADLPRLLALLGGLYRDAMAVAAGAPELATLARVGDPQALAGLGLDRLGRAVAAIVDVQLALQVNVNPTLALERLLIALKRQERQQDRQPERQEPRP